MYGHVDKRNIERFFVADARQPFSSSSISKNVTVSFYSSAVQRSYVLLTANVSIVSKQSVKNVT